jgi:hypothetical protein
MCVDVAGRQPILISKRSDQNRKSVTPDAFWDARCAPVMCRGLGWSTDAT